jgi:hypothetical protein
MNNQAKITDLNERRLSKSDPQSLSGQFRLADSDNRLKCLFWDAMNNSAGTANAALRASNASAARGADGQAAGPVDPYGFLRFPHNGDSPLGTGLVRQERCAS